MKNHEIETAFTNLKKKGIALWERKRIELEDLNGSAELKTNADVVVYNDWERGTTGVQLLERVRRRIFLRDQTTRV